MPMDKTMCHVNGRWGRGLGVTIAAGLSLLVSAHSGAAGPAEPPSVRDGYTRPTFAMPYAWTKPTLDGVVDATEWRQALCLTALQTVGGSLSTRQATFRLCWDEDHLYVAMQSPLRPGERPVQALRWRAPERNVVFDDSYEIFVDLGSKTPDGQPCFVQFLANFAGARFDAVHLPAVGNMLLNWSSGWEPVNRLTSDNVWEWEVAIPRASLFCTEPLADGQAITMLLARNFKRPWEQNSVEGTSSFAVVDTHSRYVLSKSAPAIHLRGVAQPDGQAIGLDLAAWSKTGGTVQWSFASDGKVNRQGTLVLPAGELAELAPALALDTPGPGAFRIRVGSEDGASTYLDWSALRAFGPAVAPTVDDKGDVVSLNLSLNPVADYLRVDGDFINYDARTAFKSFQIRVADAAGETVAASPLSMDGLAYVSGVLRLPGLPPGTYQARLDCLDADGKVALSRDKEFIKKDPATSFPWWKTTWGNIERVISPWTPVEAGRRDVSVWGRTMTVGAAGLPEQVVAQGHKLLAGPVRLEMATAAGALAETSRRRSKLVSQAEHRAVYEATSRLGQLDLRSAVTVEFDGMYKVELTLTPRKPVAVDSLRMVVPFAPGQVDYYHACSDQIRSGFAYGHIPAGTGRLWDCRSVGNCPMVAGSFMPYVWVGGPEAGLCWFAESDQGWVPNDEAPAIELRREPAGRKGGAPSVDLVFNLISSRTTLDAPRTLVFAFQATPVKPLHKGWREDNWWCGDTFMDWQFLGKHGGHQIWTNIPFTLEEEACREKVAARHQQGGNAVPYLEWKTLSARFAPEVAYFGDQWQTSVSDGLCFEETLSDFLVYHAGTWAKSCGIDGFYLDNSRPQACANLDAGRGYRLPDGRVQPTYNVFAVRKLLLRLRAAFLEANGRSKFVLHTTNNFIAPWLGAADIGYDGEHHVIYPQLGKDFMDYWDLTRMRLTLPAQWGVVVNFMHEYQGPWEHRRLTEVMRAYTGAVMLFDALPTGNNNGLNTSVLTARAKFGIGADDVAYIAPWQAAGAGLGCAQEDVHLAAWQRPGKVLVALVNYGEAAEAALVVDGPRLGLGAPGEWMVRDAEEGTAIHPTRDPVTKEMIPGWRWEDEAPIRHEGAATISVPVKRHSYRLVVVEHKGIAP
ncbi:MAG: hypothetical protein BWZ02_00376 [Lentisphaerae bacterium ADurb.BinA184]|nr:MAG: hypothetical protein BWZ02_00376 [Lentisphaerae bacterium ADurb.BinA184]